MYFWSMDNKKYQWMLYGIAMVILVTIGIQVYWNYKNYLMNKQQFINDVQVSLDKAVENYYTNLAKKSTIAFAFKGDLDSDSLINLKLDSLPDFDFVSKLTRDSIRMSISKRITSIPEVNEDSLFKLLDSSSKNLQTLTLKHYSNNPLGVEDLKTLTSKVIISLSNDSLPLNEIDSLFNVELDIKNIPLEYNIEYRDLTQDTNKIEWISKSTEELLTAKSKSPFLQTPSSLDVYFKNETLSILKRSSTGIFISLLLVLSVIGSLFYLIKIIKHQKQLSEIKNDLIGNITHEFKTPIATIGVALESIKDFDGINNIDKTRKYLNISEQQLSKLTTMVEKLLETATLDSQELDLKKESINISNLIELIAEKYIIQFTDKEFSIELPKEEIVANVDSFHFENVINNLLDNAIKYGGDKITVRAESNHFSFKVFVSDSGNSIIKSQKDKIFEKFYRISQGNRHDVKGFGIGLYHAKTIVEKHGGAIHLNLDQHQTTFKITLPNE